MNEIGGGKEHEKEKKEFKEICPSICGIACWVSAAYNKC